MLCIYCIYFLFTTCVLWQHYLCLTYTVPTIHVNDAMHTIPHSNHTYHTDHIYCHIKHTMPNRFTYHTYHPYNTNHSCHTYHTYHTYQTYHTFQTCHTRPTIHTIHTQHTIPHPHHTTGGEGDSATPPPHNRGGGGRFHRGQYMGPIPGGGGGGGRAWCIYILYYAIPSWKGRKWLYRNAVEFKHQRFGWTKTCVDWHSNFSPLIWLG